MDKKEKPANGLKRLEERLTKTALFPTFAAYLRVNFDGFSQIVARGGPSKWADVAAWAFEERLTGGKEITAASAKRAFEREKQRREAAKVANLQPARTAKAAHLNPLLPPLALIPPAMPQREPLPGDDDDFVFTPLKRRPKEERE